MFLGVGHMIGGGIYVLTGKVAQLTAGKLFFVDTEEISQISPMLSWKPLKKIFF